MLRIGQLAERTGVGIETIRFYEKQGLMSEPVRGENGYRRYSQNAIEELQFIRRGRLLGFSLDEIAQLMTLAHQPEQPCAKADALVAQHLRTVDHQIAELQALRKQLESLSHCESNQAAHCHLIEALEDKECCTHTHIETK